MRGDREGCHSREVGIGRGASHERRGQGEVPLLRGGTGRGATHERRGQGEVPLMRGGDKEGCHP